MTERLRQADGRGKPDGLSLKANVKPLPASVDVIVIGGGPAGAASARLLAGWGYAVLLLTKSAAHSSGLAEALPPSCSKLLAAVGLLDTVECAGFYRTRGNTVWWGESEQRSEAFSSGAGYQVVRSELERVLLSGAEAGGALVRRGATVQQVEVELGEARVVHQDADGARVTTLARSVLDCSGRAGVIARRGHRLPDAGRVTIALTGIWRRVGGWDLPDETHTLVESYSDGWAWSVPTSSDVRYVTVMVDPRTTQLQRERSFESIYRAELDKTRQLRRRLTDASPLEGPQACDASLYTACRFGGRLFLLVGDAASFIDPLSSFGVKKALGSAWLAAIVTHTRLTRPEMAESALELFGAREQKMYESARRHAAMFFADGSAAHHHPFWDDRAELSDSSAEASEHDIEVMRADPDVRVAFDVLKQAPAIRLRASDRGQMIFRPAVQGREVVLERRLVVEGWTPPGEGIRFLKGVDLPRLIEMAAGHTQVPDLFEAYQRTASPVGLPDFLGALSVLLAKGVVSNEVA